MPVLALALAHILVGDPNPAVVVRVGDHAFDKGAVLLLDVGSLAKLDLGVAHAHNQGVADPFQIGGTKNAGAAGGADLPLKAPSRKGACPELGELALEVSDLPVQLPAQQRFVGRIDEELRSLLLGKHGDN